MLYHLMILNMHLDYNERMIIIMEYVFKAYYEKRNGEIIQEYISFLSGGAKIDDIWKAALKEAIKKESIYNSELIQIRRLL